MQLTDFLIGIDEYIKNSELIRYENGIVDINFMLPIKEDKKRTGFRNSGKHLGHDGKIYIVKQAEGLKYGVSGRKYSKFGKFNPIIANAFFEFCNEESAEAILALEKPPYYEILSRDFTKENQIMISLEDIDYDFKYDENQNISHEQIILALEQYIRDVASNKLTNEEIERECNKVKLQYAVQETLKKIICSCDQNLGNTSLLIEKNKDGKTDINISPAYDMDLSFNLGEEIIDGDIYQKSILHRTSKNGSIKLEDIAQEFANTIPGYKEKMQEIISKFNNNYVNAIFDTAYNNSKANAFKDEKLKKEYETFIVRKIAEIKGIIASISKLQMQKEIL